jgi:hypothetical protein
MIVPYPPYNAALRTIISDSYRDERNFRAANRPTSNEECTSVSRKRFLLMHQYAHACKLCETLGLAPNVVDDNLHRSAASENLITFS